MHCLFCGHRSDDGHETPAGTLCVGCARRLAHLVLNGGQGLITACWGLDLPIDEQRVRALAGRRAGETVIDISTRAPDWCLDLAEEASDLGLIRGAVNLAVFALAQEPSADAVRRALGLLLGRLATRHTIDTLRARLFGA